MIPVSQPSIGSRERKYARDAINSGWVSSKGPYIEKFEHAWATYNGMKYGRGCSSGTNALYLALLAMGVGPGDEVIVPEFTMVASAWAVTYTGATPVFVDCRDDLNINPSKIEEKISNRTKAIMPVHIYGRQCDMPKINEIARKHGLFVVEDCAESHGIKPKGDIACFSFFGNKIITTGEGGMCVTNNEKWAKEIEKLRSVYFDPKHTFLHPKIGYNFRMTNIQAAIGLAQVERIDSLLAKRKLIASWYKEFLPQVVQMPSRNVLWMMDIDLKGKRDKVKAYLDKKGIDTRYFFKPMSAQPMYNRSYEHLKAWDWSKRGIYLPVYFDLTKEQVKFISQNVQHALKK